MHRSLNNCNLSLYAPEKKPYGSNHYFHPLAPNDLPFSLEL